MLYIDTHVCSIYSSFCSQQPPSSARGPATHRGRVLQLIPSYAQKHNLANTDHGIHMVDTLWYKG
jgi:hypothetical protein